MHRPVSHRLLPFVAFAGGLAFAPIATATQAPYDGTPQEIPGRIEAEQFDEGGAGVAYADTTAGNVQNQFRLDVDVDIGTDDGGFTIKNTAAGEWLEYTVNVTGGVYDIEARYSSPSIHKLITVSLDGELLTSLSFPSTGSYSDYATIARKGIFIPGGSELVLRIDLRGGFNLNWLNFSYVAPPPTIADRPAELTLLPPSGRHMSIYSLSGYTAEESRLDEEWEEFPLYLPYNNEDPLWWDNLLAEQMQARLPVIMLAARRTADEPSGDMNPRDLDRAVDAMARAGIGPDLMKIANFIDTPFWPIKYDRLYGSGDNTMDFDFANQDAWETIVWNGLIKPWFKEIPETFWHRVNDRPVIHIWGINPGGRFTNHAGNVSAMTTWIADQFETTFGVRPWFIHMSTSTSPDQDPSLLTNPDVLGFDGWIGDGHTVATHRNFTHATVCPAYQEFNPSHVGRLQIPRRDGATFVEGMDAAWNQRANQVLLEGWTNFLESMGLYRSEESNWVTPNQYINLLRRYTDPATETLLLEAEGADTYSDTTPGNSGGEFRRSGDLDINNLFTGTGWMVADTTAGEWIEHTNVYFSEGEYQISVKYACSADQSIRVLVDGTPLSTVDLPNTGGAYNFAYLDLGNVSLTKGTHSLRFEFVSGGVNVDWFFVRKTDGPPAEPAGLNATSGDTSVVLRWSENGDRDFQRYNVYRSTSSGSYGDPIASVISQSALLDSGLTNDTTYHYVVTAVDEDGNESETSAEVAVIPATPPLIFSDNFNNNQGSNFDGWIEALGNGAYVEESGRLNWNLGSDEIAHLILYDRDLNSNELDIWVDVGATDGAGNIHLYFLYQDANNWYRLNVDGANSSQLEKMVAGSLSAVGTAGNGVEISGSLRRWHLTVDPAMGQITFVADSVEILSVSETLQFTSGRIGLGGDGRRPLWDNFTAAIPSSAMASFHSADYSRNYRIDLSELLRVIEIYNTRKGTSRTGRYAVDAGSVDGFSSDPQTTAGTAPLLSRFHSADFDRNGELTLSELLRVIEIYNTRAGTSRTGQYREDSGSVDGFTSD